ncbi:MAG: undecaprenyl-diphosphate phosphatase [Acidaminococcales bacterium]|jgi:undecaprenyl-diphosphatase|nr:undecaprenyl-diphosphate phosphatase [Acidaminococcales bacterium]
MDGLAQAVIVGVVEGLTEFLPISSTGHMIIVGNAIGFKGEMAGVFEVAIQLGAILSVIYLYRQKFARFFTRGGLDPAGGLSVWHVGAGMAPVMGTAFLAHGYIKNYLFSPYTVAVGLILGGALMLAAEKGGAGGALDETDQMTVKQAFLIGLFQILALWPGFSRSGSTISGGLFLGLSRRAAAEFSFIVAVPVMFAACLYDLHKNFALLDAGNLALLAVGSAVACLTASLSIAWFVKFLNKSSLKSFAVYRFLLAAVTFWYFS